MNIKRLSVCKILVIILMCLFGVSACSNSKSNPEEEKIRQALVGEWRSYYTTGKYDTKNMIVIKFEANSYSWQSYFIPMGETEYCPTLKKPYSSKYNIDTDQKQVVLDADQFVEGFNTIDYLYNDSGQLSLTKNSGELSFKKVK